MRSNTYHIAVLMTCYNRVKTTLTCLDHLFAQNFFYNVSLKIFLVDDGSTDRTGEKVKNRFPDINLLKGDGNLFWCGGMRLAFGTALKDKFDYYLWLNDDSMLFKYAIKKMIETSLNCKKEMGKDCIIVGSMQDKHTKKFTYGGYKKNNFWNPLSFKRIEPDNYPKECDVFNGNCVLIPDTIARTIGNLSSDFTHGIGDYEYGIRAKRNGFAAMTASGFMGTCYRNSQEKTYKDNTLNFRERVVQLSDIKTIPPADEYMKFIRINGGFFWPIYWLRTFIRKTFPLFWLFLRQKV